MGVVLLLSLVLLAFPSPGSGLRYELSLSLHNDRGWELQGMETVSGLAPEGAEGLVFRLYPAAGAGFRLLGAWDEAGDLPLDSVEPTAVFIPLRHDHLKTFSISLSFETTIPPFPGHAYGVFSAAPTSISLAQGYPILCAHDGDWIVEPIFPWGDWVVADVADYSVEILVPEGWEAVTSGVEEGSSGATVARGENLREFMFVLIDPKAYAIAEEEVGGIPVRSYFLSDHREAGEEALRVTVDALKLYEDLFGPYPFPELEVVEVPLTGAAGAEYPGLILASEAHYGEFLRRPDGLFFPMIFAHEVAHQWWYAQVGSDQVREPWVDEALATFTSGLYFERIGREEVLRYWQETYRLGKERNPKATVFDPLWSFPDGEGYGGIVYSGGALMLQEIRERMGDDSFFGALRKYLEAFRWRIARGEDLLVLLRSESRFPIDDILSKWSGDE